MGQTLGLGDSIAKLSKVLARGGGGLVVNVLAFYSDNPSSNPGDY